MTSKNQRTAFILIIIGLFIGCVLFVRAGNPSMPTNITINNNVTSSYPNGTQLNNTRGFVYNITINESQPTNKWLGYVGNVNGEFALMNSDSEALYDWDIITITGEVYATKEGPNLSTTGREDECYNCGMVPNWSNVVCLNSSMLTTEETFYSHTSTDEDSFSNTFTNGTLFNLTNVFYAGEREVNDTSLPGGASGKCYGTYLNAADATQYENWTEVLLTDQTYQWADDSFTTVVWDVIYAVLLENDTIGYDGNTYDFQILLPQNGSNGSVNNIAFFFYVELI